MVRHRVAARIEGFAGPAEVAKTAAQGIEAPRQALPELSRLLFEEMSEVARGFLRYGEGVFFAT